MVDIIGFVDMPQDGQHALLLLYNIYRHDIGFPFGKNFPHLEVWLLSHRDAIRGIDRNNILV